LFGTGSPVGEFTDKYFSSECVVINHMEKSIVGSAKVFYTVAEVAVQFGISTKSVYRLLERGLLKSSSALRRKMIPRASVETFIAASLQGGAR